MSPKNVKRIIGILCQIAGVMVSVTGLLPILHIARLSQNDARVGYYEYMYFDYNSVLAVIILLARIAGGIILLWLGSRLKSKRSVQK